MPRRKIILFAWLLALSAARADTAWDFALHLDEDYQPAGKISVVLDSTSYLVTDKPLGSYRTIERTNYNARQIPTDAAVACQGWWGNHDEEMYVQVNPARLFVYRREFFETDPPPPFTLYKTISLKSAAAETPEPASPPAPALPPPPMASGGSPAVTNRPAPPKLTAKPAAPKATRPQKAPGGSPVASPKLSSPTPAQLPMAPGSSPASSSPAAVPQTEPAAPVMPVVTLTVTNQPTPPKLTAKPAAPNSAPSSPVTRHAPAPKLVSEGGSSPLPAAPSGSLAGGSLVRLNNVLPMGVRSNEWFSCQVTIANHGDTAISVTNLFNQAAGLELKITDTSGMELGRTFAEPLRNHTWTVPVGKSVGYRVSFGRPGALGAPVILPDTVKTVRVQLQGTIAGSGNSGALTSNIVEVDIPE